MAKTIQFYFQRDSEYQFHGFTVDTKFNSVQPFCGHEVFNFETLEVRHPPEKFHVFVAIGPAKMNRLRAQKVREVRDKGYQLATYISPLSAVNSPVGSNCFVGDMAVIGPFVNVGDNNIIYDSVVVSSDATIGDNCYLGPQSYIGTFCMLQNNSFLGTAATIKSSVNIGEQSFIGAKSYISKNTEPKSVFGVRQSECLGPISDSVPMI